MITIAAVGAMLIPLTSGIAADPNVPKSAQLMLAQVGGGAGKAASIRRAGRLPGSESGARADVVSLEELGYLTGILFEGVESSHARTVFFPIPEDVEIPSGVLRIKFSSSPILHAKSNLRVYVNGLPRAVKLVSPSGGAVTTEIKLSAPDLEAPFLRIEFMAALLISDNRCLDERTSGSYLHIAPETALELRFGSGADSVRAAWNLLPEKVRVGLPTGKLDPQVFALAWNISDMLQREGKRVAFSRLPDLGDIVIAPRNQIATSLKRTVASLPGQNVAVLKQAGRTVLAVSEPFDVEPFYFLSREWVRLAQATAYEIGPRTKKKLKERDDLTVTLDRLGLDTGTRYMFSSAEWNFTLGPRQLPPGYRPQRLQLNVVSTPSFTGNPVMFYTYIDDILHEVVKLSNENKAQSLTIQLPAHRLGRVSHFRFVAQRERMQGDCQGDVTRYPIQILRTSTMIATHDRIKPYDFSTLAAYLNLGFDTYLPQNVLENPETVLGLLGRLTSQLALPVPLERVKYYSENQLIGPDAPFLLVGRAQLDAKSIPVRFDRGRVKVVDHENATLLDVDALPGIAVAQMVESGDYGLWLAPAHAGSFPELGPIQLERGDAAFIDASGVLAAIDTRQRDLARVDYPDHIGLFSWLSRYRFWLLALVWIGVTILFVHLYRQVRKHRKTTD